MASIPLTFQMPKFNDPVEQQFRSAQAQREMMEATTQRALGPMQIQQAGQALESNRLAFQERELTLADQQALNKAYQDAGGDLDKTLELAPRYGVSAKLVAAFQQQITESKQRYASLTKDRLANVLAQNEMFRGVVDSILRADDGTPEGQTKASSLWSQQVARLPEMVKSGTLSPEVAQFIPQEYPGTQGMKVLSNMLTTGEQLAKEANQAQTAAASALTAKTGALTAETGKLREQREQEEQAFQQAVSSLAAAPPATKEEYQLRVGSLPAAVATRILTAVPVATYDVNASPTALNQMAMTAAQRATEARERAPTEVSLAATAADPTKTPEERKAAEDALKKLGESRQASRINIQAVIPGLSMEATALTGEAYLRTLPPGAAAQVKAIALGQSALPSASTRSQAAQQLRNAVFQYDAGFSEELYPTRRATSIAYNTGRPAIELSAMNTVLGHVGVLDQAALALKNGDVRALNAVANRAAVEIGKSPVITFKTIVHRVGPELIRAYVGAGGDERERREAGADFSENNSPDQIRGAAVVTAKLLSSKVQASLFGYRRGMNFRADDPRGQELVNRFFTPEARSVMDRMVGPGWDTGALTAGTTGTPKFGVVAPDGNTYTFPDQKSADAFRERIGVK